LKYFWENWFLSLIKPVRKLNQFNKKLVLEPVYETGLPALILISHQKLLTRITLFHFAREEFWLVGSVEI
jgi:hypothetical protein